jgi:hypothetical protein
MLDNALSWARSKPSDINEHIDLLLELGEECSHITEMGVRTGVSTRAFMQTGATLRCYDLELNPRLVEIFKLLQDDGRDVEYIKADVLDLDIVETDLLFIDTWHAGVQLEQELKIHGNKARKYIAFHDTHTFGTRDEILDGRPYQLKPIAGEGLLPQVIQFIIDNPHWRFKIHRTNNNGLTVLERCE